MGSHGIRGALAALALLASGCLSVPENGGGDGGGSGGAACGTLAALREPFDGALAAGRWSHHGTVTAAGDHVILSKASAEDTDLQGETYYTLAGSALVVQVGRFELGGGTLQVSLEAANGDAVVLELLGTTITVSTDVGASRTTKGAFDLEAGLFWQIAEAGGEIVVSTSVEGLAFDEQLRFANPVRQPAVHVEIELESTGSSFVEILGLNEHLTADEVQPSCPITDLPDGLDDPDGAEWASIGLDDGCGVSVSGGVLTVVQPAADVECGYRTLRAFALGEHAVVVRHTAIGGGGGVNFQIELPSGDRYQFHVHPVPADATQRELLAEVYRGDDTFDIVAVADAYDLAEDAYWAFVPIGGTLALRTSPSPGDVASWPLLAQIDLQGQAVDEVRFSLSATEVPSDPALPIRFDGFAVE